MNIIKLSLSLLISTVIIGTSCGVVLANGEEAMSAAALYEKKCSICHVIERSKSKNKTEAGWRTTVMRMKNNNGAPITDEEAELIIKHLAEHYGK